MDFNHISKNLKLRNEKLEQIEKEEGITSKFKGLWTPREIVLTPDLNQTEKSLLSIIFNLDNSDFNDGEPCFASNRYFASILNTSEDNVRKALAKLRKKGLISTAKFDGRKRWLRTNLSLAIKKEKNKKEGSW